MWNSPSKPVSVSLLNCDRRATIAVATLVLLDASQTKMPSLRVSSATLLFCCASGAFAQAVPAEAASPEQIVLTLGKGVPLRVIVTGKLRFKQNQPVHARLVEPLFAFDREVVPAGTEVTGTIKSLDPVDRRRRVRAILGGDFTPLHDPKI